MKIPERERRDWRLTFLILLVGLSIMCLAGEFALKMAPRWSVQADMGSLLDPDATFAAFPTVNLVEPVLPEIETPISFEFLTPATNTVIVTATATFLPGTPSPTLEPTETPVMTATLTLSPTATHTFTPSPTSTATPTRTYTPTPTKILPTWTFTPVPTSTRTRTPTPTYTFTPTRTPTRTPTPTSTYTPTSTFTPTSTYTPTITFTPSNTPFPSDTPTPVPPGCTSINSSGSYAVSSLGTWFCFQTDGTNNGAVLIFSVPDLLAADGAGLLWTGKVDPGDAACGLQSYVYSFGSGIDAVTLYTVKNNLSGNPLQTYIFFSNIGSGLTFINVSVDNPSWSTSGTDCPP